MKTKKIIAIIPARKGSKRLVNKNLLEINGKPLIEWTIDAVKNSNVIDEVIVSTDSHEIKKFAESKGLKVPFLRPKNLSDDSTSSIDVVYHALDFYKNLGYSFKYCMLLQPTSPLRRTSDIDQAFKFLSNEAKAVVSLCETDDSPIWCNTLPENMYMGDFLQEKFKNSRSQDLPSYYRLNGALYISEVDYLYENNGFIGEKTKAYIMPKSRSIDIDDELDFACAEYLLKKEKNEK